MTPGWYGRTETSPALHTLFDAGKLLSFHGMNLHYTNWHKPGIQRPSWLHCIPIGMRIRFFRHQGALSEFVDAIKRNVAERPEEFWTDETRPLLLVPIIRRRYAPDRSHALAELNRNVKNKKLVMTEKTFPNPVGKAV